MKIPILAEIERHIRKIKNAPKRRVNGTNNVINISKKDLPRVSLKIQGNNNYIEIKKLNPSERGKIKIVISGDNCKVKIDENVSISGDLTIQLGQIHPNFEKIKNITVTIGKNTSFGGINIISYNSNANIKIGDNCMFSFYIWLYHTDGHPIFDIRTNKITNIVKDMVIGNHCWVGANATILKNVTIADNCIVGWGAIVTKSFINPNCAIAGNPAKVVKTGVNWSGEVNEEYMQNERIVEEVENDQEIKRA